MSLWADAKIKELLARVTELERRLDRKDTPTHIDDSIVDTIRQESKDLLMSELVRDYTEKFGKPPHHFMKADSIMKALR